MLPRFSECNQGSALILLMVGAYARLFVSFANGADYSEVTVDRVVLSIHLRIQH